MAKKTNKTSHVLNLITNGMPPEPENEIPPAPENEIPLAPENEIPLAPENEIPLAPENEIPLAPENEIPLAPENEIPLAPENEIPLAPEHGGVTGAFSQKPELSAPGGEGKIGGMPNDISHTATAQGAASQTMVMPDQTAVVQGALSQAAAALEISSQAAAVLEAAAAEDHAAALRENAAALRESAAAIREAVAPSESAALETQAGAEGASTNTPLRNLTEQSAQPDGFPSSSQPGLPSGSQTEFPSGSQTVLPSGSQTVLPSGSQTVLPSGPPASAPPEFPSSTTQPDAPAQALSPSAKEEPGPRHSAVGPDSPGGSKDLFGKDSQTMPLPAGDKKVIVVNKSGENDKISNEILNQLTSHLEEESMAKQEVYCMVNVMEQILDHTNLERHMETYGVCMCSRCKADIKALILTRLPAKYVVVHENSVSPIIGYYENKFRVRILTEIIKACMDVKNDPRHGSTESIQYIKG